MGKSRTITLVYAPFIPNSEVLKLEKLWEKKRSVVVNYEVYTTQFTFSRGVKTLITAPGIPKSELKTLRARIRTTPNGGAVFTNYDINVRQIQL